MNIIKSKPGRPRFMALLLTTLLTFPVLSACGSSKQTSAPPPPVDDSRAGGVEPNRAPSPSPQAKKGLSNTQKVVILAGAAALYYLYNQHRNKQEQRPQGQYYLSKNGRVYYRDAQHRAHWVTPPPEGIKVPETEAARYRDFQGYNNQTTGKDLIGLPEATSPVPAQ
ncbi:hypothetical protein [Oscillatoria sp. FACHB-1406]|uniref:hypothetical protein n=1 Tax=Oscillatoria sp. FACHB-1406 TaxID=2692846 RepID=UPI001689D247|nr:hypothetical protein [Oscillatoria sp. FACHB-1406]MBD2579523.1 hypothetical protein [Oscillatoria sp. FACHB-1406]